MKMVTVRITSVDNNKIVGLEIGGQNSESGNIVEIPMNRNIYLGLLAEMKKANVPIDEDLKCFIGKVFTIVEKDWKRPPKDLSVIPIVFGVTLRKDLEMIKNEEIK